MPMLRQNAHTTSARIPPAPPFNFILYPFFFRDKLASIFLFPRPRFPQQTTVLDAAKRPVSNGEIGACSLGVVLFRALGGKFCSVAPSALHMPGAFSR